MRQSKKQNSQMFEILCMVMIRGETGHKNHRLDCVTDLESGFGTVKANIYI